MIMDPTTIGVIRIMVTITTTKTDQEITSSNNRIVNRILMITTTTTISNRKSKIALRKTKVTTTTTLTPDSNNLNNSNNSILPLMLRDNKKGIRSLRIISLISWLVSTSKGNQNKIPKMSSTSLETIRYRLDRLSALWGRSPATTNSKKRKMAIRNLNSKLD